MSETNAPEIDPVQSEAVQNEPAMDIETLASMPKTSFLSARLLKALRPKKSVKLSTIKLPTTKMRVENLRFDAAHLKRFKSLCGFDKSSSEVPLCYPHLITFDLHMYLLTSENFPFNLLGTVHIENHIERFDHTPLDQNYTVDTYLDNLTPHSKGASYDLVTEYRNGENDKLLWREHSKNLVMLPRKYRDLEPPQKQASDSRAKEPCSEQAEVWKLASNLGREYGAISGDRNPIHLYPLTAKLFGFKRHIIHGMWTLSRSNASAEAFLNKQGWDTGRLSMKNRFYRPVFLPAKVHHYIQAESLSEPDSRGSAQLQVWNPAADNLHMQAEIQQL